MGGTRVKGRRKASAGAAIARVPGHVRATYRSQTANTKGRTRSRRAAQLRVCWHGDDSPMNGAPAQKRHPSWPDPCFVFGKAFPKYIAVLSDDESEDCADVDPPPRHHPVAQVEPIPPHTDHPKSKMRKVWVSGWLSDLAVLSRATREQQKIMGFLVHVFSAVGGVGKRQLCKQTRDAALIPAGSPDSDAQDVQMVEG
ncbi:hypothetical protein C0Q70_13756 [Pomacea canaliculata]|uniref:Uncharacterized protein n=1 Tax=Pomacea canaliculata TaxID=400727 RepID=A0A2T7NY31_POMCA|nr:hypothetical protein C0Q70_13756 [Pomacea canaliculata]